MARRVKSRRQLQRKGMIVGAFAWRSIEMLKSPAYRVLSLSAHRVMARLEIEFAHHGGKPEENGRLPCAYDHFGEFGIERHAIGPAIREAVALGFVEITRQGCAGNAGYRLPAWYRLTYRHAGPDFTITDDWRRIQTLEEAAAIAKAARERKPEHRPKFRSPVRETPTGPSAGNPTNRVESPVRETPTTSPVRTTSIFLPCGGCRWSDPPPQRQRPKERRTVTNETCKAEQPCGSFSEAPLLAEDKRKRSKRSAPRSKSSPAEQ